MATSARERLSRAEHFLDLTQQHSADRERFTIYFETFVVYARSVLHVLKNEVDAAGVFACFEPEWNRLAREALPQFFRDSRDIVLKEGGVATETRAEYAVTLTATLPPGAGRDEADLDDPRDVQRCPWQNPNILTQPDSCDEVGPTEDAVQDYRGKLLSFLNLEHLVLLRCPLN